MNKEDLPKFEAILQGCAEVVARAPYSRMAIDLFFGKLAGYELRVVMLAMTKAIEKCSNAYDFNISLVLTQINMVNKIDMAQALAIQQDKQDKRDAYALTDECKANAESGKEILRSVTKLLKDY